MVRQPDGKSGILSTRYVLILVLMIPLCVLVLWHPHLPNVSTVALPHVLSTRSMLYRSLRHDLPLRCTVVEIGVWKGGNAQLLYDILNPARMILADLWAETSDPRYTSQNEGIVRRRFESEIARGVVHVRKGPSLEQIERFGEGEIDLLYLDTTHMYRQTLLELMAAERVVGKRGYLCGHDFLQPKGMEISYGVIAAVVEFALRRGWVVTHVTSDQFRSFCMRRRAALAGG